MITPISFSLLQNRFDNVTKNNYKRMLLLSRDHTDKLAAEAPSNPQIDVIYQVLKPFFDTFVDLYSDVQNAFALYQSNTKRVTTLFDNLRSDLIRQWDVQIQVVYDAKSPEYMQLLAGGREPFQSKAYELRISAVNSLHKALQTMANPNLATLTTQIGIFLTTLQQTRSAQQGTERKDTELRQNLEAARKTLATEMHGAFFKLGALYYHDVAHVETYYELQYLRSTNRPTETDTTPTAPGLNVNPQSRLTLLTGNFTPADSFTLRNTGNTTLFFWLSATPDSEIPPDASALTAGETGQFDTTDLSDTSTPLKYLICYNPDDDTAGAASATKI